jgi:hypothetical protein
VLKNPEMSLLEKQATLLRRNAFCILLIIICLQLFTKSVNAQSVRLNITAVSVMSTTDVGGESPDYRWQIWFNDVNEPGCIGLDNKEPDKWYAVSYTVVNNEPIDLDTDIGLAVEAWEEDSYFDCGDWSSCGQGNCTYNSGCACDDDDHMSKRLGVITEGPYAGTGKFKLYDYGPGNNNNFVTIVYGGGKWSVKYKVTYTIPSPTTPPVEVDGLPYESANICEEETISLSTSTAINPLFNSSVRYVWEFRIDDETAMVWVPNPAYCDCGGGGGIEEPLAIKAKPTTKSKTSNKVSTYVIDPGENPPCCSEPRFIQEEQAVWRTAGSTLASDPDNGKATFEIRKLSGLSSLTEKVVVDFRVHVVANGLSSSYRSANKALNVSPKPPEFESISIDPSCPNKNSGVIRVTGITGAGEYQYNLRPGYNNNEECDPEEDGSCFSGILTGSVGPMSSMSTWPTSKFSIMSNISISKIIIPGDTIIAPPGDGGGGGDTGDGFTIYNVPHGEYTLWISNYGPNRGSCFTTVDSVTVIKIPELFIQLTELKNVTCNGGSNAEISLTRTGGIEPFTFSLKAESDSTGNTTGVFDSLAVGNYLASVTDGCLQDSSITQRALTIKQPAKLAESTFNSQDATCVNPGNGSLTTGVSKPMGTYDTIVSSTYLYRLFKDNVIYDTWESTDPNSSKDGLPISSNYQLIVTEKGSLDCNGYEKTFSVVAPEPLNITNLVTDSVNCFGGSDGTVAFEGTGGSDEFLFKLSKTAGDTIANAIGSFSDLEGGDYALIIENNLSGCLDKSTYPDIIKVAQPDSIAIILDKNDITCFGSNDGNISASVSGGTPGYTYAWEKFDAPVWNIFSTATSLTNQSAGVFRLKITDSKNCPDFSNSVSIIEPAALDISSVTVHDIKCFGEQGSIEIISSGGTLPYSNEYSLNSGTFTTFNAATLLNEGSYVVKTVDKNGCSIIDTETYLITSPSSALDFTYTKSDYNGFNISCFGGSNGYIKLVGNGGNGATYIGYQYALDSGSFQTLDTLKTINAGTHNLSTMDGRGCIVSKDILFTQTSAVLSVLTFNKQDVVCYGDLSGSIEVQGAGGLSPYQFNIDASSNQSSTLFSSLGVGSYSIQITDFNGCTASYTEEILTLNPRIQFQSTITDVSCFGGTDGSIALNVTDGVQPFQFAWAGQSSITEVLSNVGQGQYSVTITDNAGCKRDSSFSIAQPAQALRMSIYTVPVCYGSVNGIITITAGGGTSPYQYSIDNGASFQSNNIFNTVGVGNYAVKVLDDNGCAFLGSTEVIQRNDRPEPNFLVATRQNAFDTLIIKEISLPKPDSIYWIFDPNATIISDDQWSPQLKFSDAGTYFISMTGFFGGCDYSVTKNLTLNPFDPNATPSKEVGYRAIESVTLSPNPNNGEFDLNVKLTKKYNLSIVVYDMVGVAHYGNKWQQIQELTEKISLPLASSGIYLLRVITDTDARDIRIIINK